MRRESEYKENKEEANQESLWCLFPNPPQIEKFSLANSVDSYPVLLGAGPS